MKISLLKLHSFWGLMNPTDLKLTASLTEEAPVIEINESKLYPWEIKQILGSIREKKITISVQVEDLVKLIPTEEKEKKVVRRTKTATATALKA